MSIGSESEHWEASNIIFQWIKDNNGKLDPVGDVTPSHPFRLGVRVKEEKINWLGIFPWLPPIHLLDNLLYPIISVNIVIELVWMKKT